MSGEKHDPRGLKSPLAKWHSYCAHMNFIRRKYTRQGRFESSFLSLDWINEYNSTLQVSDKGLAVEKLVAHLDEPYRRRLEEARLHRRELRFRQAIYALRDYPELQKTLRAIRRSRRREKNFSALKIRPETYRERFFQLTKILKSRLVIQRAVMIGNVPADEPHKNQRKAHDNEQSNTGHKRQR